ncbi:HD domain-containing protein [bacterium]|nr:HD domain-containing protein [bacterium]
MNERISKIKDFVANMPSSSDHDFEHTIRVYNLCLHLARLEKNVDMEILEAAALLHDIGRIDEDKDSNLDHAIIGAKKAVPILQELNFSVDQIEKIKHCICAHRYRNKVDAESIEAKILFDADKLDSTGAIGVARAMAWVGKKNKQIYTTAEETEKAVASNCKNADSPQTEYEIKVKYISEKMFTCEGKRIAIERTKFYRGFLDRLEKEILGEK